jgi:hypothetical protein
MFRGYIGARIFLLSSLLCLTAASAGAQVCNNPGAYCEGWSRDSTRREVSLTRTTECSINLTPCPAVCTSGPITALPSIRIGNLNHVVLGFTITNACVPECPGAIQEDCFNVGVSYRRKVNTGSEAVTNTFFCDPSDPTTMVSGGATFTGNYATGGTENVTISNIVYGATGGPDDCGAPPTSLDMVGTGPNLAVSSHFTFDWIGNTLLGYHETRIYANQPAGQNTVTIHVTNINFGAQTYTVSVTGADTPTHSSTWGQLKLLYR